MLISGLSVQSMDNSNNMNHWKGRVCKLFVDRPVVGAVSRKCQAPLGVRRLHDAYQEPVGLQD